MTTFRVSSGKCAVCGKRLSTHTYLTTHVLPQHYIDGYNANASSLMVCPDCGYVTYDFEERSEEIKNYVLSDEYKNCDGLKFVDSSYNNKLGRDNNINLRNYYRLYLLGAKTEAWEDAYLGLRYVMYNAGISYYKYYLPLVYDLFVKAYGVKPRSMFVNIDYLRQLGRNDEIEAVFKDIDWEDYYYEEAYCLLWEKALVKMGRTRLYKKVGFERFNIDIIELLTELIKYKPGEIKAYRDRADEYAKRNNYKMAAADEAKVRSIKSFKQ